MGFEYFIYISVVAGAYWFGYWVGATRTRALCKDMLRRHMNDN